MATEIIIGIIIFTVLAIIFSNIGEAKKIAANSQWSGEKRVREIMNYIDLNRKEARKMNKEVDVKLRNRLHNAEDRVKSLENEAEISKEMLIKLIDATGFDIHIHEPRESEVEFVKRKGKK